MGRIECETAAQCQRIAQEVEPLMETGVTVAVIAVVAFSVALTVYRVKTND